MVDEIKINDKDEKQISGFWVLLFFALFLIAIIILGAMMQ